MTWSRDAAAFARARAAIADAERAARDGDDRGAYRQVIALYFATFGVETTEALADIERRAAALAASIRSHPERGA